MESVLKGGGDVIWVFGELEVPPHFLKYIDYNIVK